MRISKEKTLLGLAVAFIFLVIASATLLFSVRKDTPALDYRNTNTHHFPYEGKLTQASLVAGPFDVHRRYKSMEGPYVLCTFKVGDLIASKEVALPESLVSYDIKAGNLSMLGSNSKSTRIAARTNAEPRSLLWLKGVKLEVLDEENKVLPTAEFICHFNIEINRAFRAQIFPQSEWCTSPRLITISQGQTEEYFPEGFAVPAASDEEWNFAFQLANRTTDKHRRLKHRCTLYFVKDSDLTQPITALNWYTPYVYVAADPNFQDASHKDACLSCFGMTAGVNAPNNILSLPKDDQGLTISPHWIVPPGVHTYTTHLAGWIMPGFSEKPRTIHAVWSHVHPFCTSLALYKCNDKTRQKIFSNSVETKTSPGLEIKSIEYLSSKQGISTGEVSQPHYVLETTYSNTSGVAQDAMASVGIFCADGIFVKPEWAQHASSPPSSLVATKQ